LLVVLCVCETWSDILTEKINWWSSRKGSWERNYDFSWRNRWLDNTRVGTLIVATIYLQLIQN